MEATAHPSHSRFLFVYFTCLCRYLGDTPEWEFIPENDICMLPFKMHRESMSKQRVREKYVKSRRGRV